MFLSPLALSHGAVLCGPPDTIDTFCSAGFIPPHLLDKHTNTRIEQVHSVLKDMCRSDTY